MLNHLIKSSKKPNLIFLFSALLLVTTVGCQKFGGAPKSDSDKSKASYAIGKQIGTNFKSQGVDMDPDALLAGLKDGQEGKEPRLKEEEMRNAMMKLQEQAQKKMGEDSEKNKKTGVDFLEKNKAKAGVKTTASGLQYEVVKEGTGKMPSDKDKVSVHYTGTLISGEKFDSSVDRGQPAEFPVNGVIAGWTEALKLMKAGSKWKLVIPSDLAYGPQGRPGIPPNSVLLFDVELLEVK